MLSCIFEFIIGIIQLCENIFDFIQKRLLDNIGFLIVNLNMKHDRKLSLTNICPFIRFKLKFLKFIFMSELIYLFL